MTTHRKEQAPELGPPLRDRSARPRRVDARVDGCADLARRSPFDGSIVILVVGVDVRLDLGIRRRPHRQRHDALPRRALRTAVPAVRDHHRHRADGEVPGRAADRLHGAGAVDHGVVHVGADHARSDAEPQGERVRRERRASRRASAARIITKHVLPNTIGVMVVAIFLEIPNAILGEAFLSFLGLGVQPPDPSGA